MAVKRSVIVTLISGKDTLPNGDPDAENMPRTDVKPDGYTYGVITEVCIKSKLRGEVEREFKSKPPYDIFIKKGVPLVNGQKEAIEANKEDPQKYLFSRYWDWRAFGGFGAGGKGEEDVGDEAATTPPDGNDSDNDKKKGGKAGKKAKKKLDFSVGNVSGPVYIGYGETCHPIEVVTDTKTRKCLTNADDADKDGDEKGAKAESGTMYPSHFIRFGLYVVPGRIVPAKIGRTGFSQEDVEVLYKALAKFAMHEGSATRKLNVEAVYVFELAEDAYVKDSILEDVIRQNIVLDTAMPRSMDEVNIPPLEWVKGKIEKMGLSKIVSVREIVSELHVPVNIAAGGSYADYLKEHKKQKKQESALLTA